jgi:hypothetical protein
MNRSNMHRGQRLSASRLALGRLLEFASDVEKSPMHTSNWPSESLEIEKTLGSANDSKVMLRELVVKIASPTGLNMLSVKVSDSV